MEISGQAPSIEILLATCNGERFLAEQLDSLLAQELRDFTIIASDDCSSDGTWAILEQFAAAHPGLLRLLEPGETRLGANANFARLLDAASADYVAFCDQDDVWLPDKLAASLALMRETEAAHGSDCPLLIHTDLAVVDVRLNELGPSFMRYAGIDPRRSGFGQLLLGNVVTGCTALTNRALYKLARPIPPGTLMFDHWFAQVAAGLGRIAYLDRATIRYRQHNANAVGAMRKGTASFLLRVHRILFSDVTLRVFVGICRHAEKLVERFGDRLGDRDLTRAQILAGLWRLSRLSRFAALWRADLRKPTFVAGVGLFLLVLRDPSVAREQR